MCRNEGKTADQTALAHLPAPLTTCIESLLIVADQPVSVALLAEHLQVDQTLVEAALWQLQHDYDGECGDDEPNVIDDADDGADHADDGNAHVLDDSGRPHIARNSKNDHNAGNASDNQYGGIVRNDQAHATHAHHRVPRGFALRCGIKGWQLVSRSSCDELVTSFLSEGQRQQLSPAAMEALAIIAYRQPITRTGVASIRAVNSDGVIRTLILHGLVLERGYESQTHAAFLVTSGLFLEYMGIASLEDLPSLAPLLPSSAREMLDTFDDQRELAEQSRVITSSVVGSSSYVA